MDNGTADVPGHQPAGAAHHGFEDVVSYCDGDLSAAGTEALEAHVAWCEECRRLLATAERVLAEVDRIVERPFPSEPSRPPAVVAASETDLLVERLRERSRKERLRERSRKDRLGEHSTSGLYASAPLRPPWRMRQPSKRFWLPLAGVALVAAVVAMIQLLLAWKLPQLGKRLGARFEGSPAAEAGELTNPAPAKIPAAP